MKRNRAKIKKNIIDLLTSERYGDIEISEITEDIDIIKDLCMDSLSFVSFICDVEEINGVLLTDDILLLNDNITIEKIVDLIDKNKA